MSIYMSVTLSRLIAGPISIKFGRGDTLNLEEGLSVIPTYAQVELRQKLVQLDMNNR